MLYLLHSSSYLEPSFFPDFFPLEDDGSFTLMVPLYVGSKIVMKKVFIIIQTDGFVFFLNTDAMENERQRNEQPSINQCVSE